MKIIFLDIDGVLNNINRDDKHKCLDSSPCHFYSERCVEQLNQLIEATGAKIVVSSTWRLGEDIFSMKQIIRNIGVKGEVIGMTESNLGRGSLRGNEIYVWCKQNSINDSSYVILDDDSDMLYWQRNNFINVDAFNGLTPKDCFKAKKILGVRNEQD